MMKISTRSVGQQDPKSLRTKSAANKQDPKSLEVEQNRENQAHPKKLRQKQFVQAPGTRIEIRTGRQLSKQAESDNYDHFHSPDGTGSGEYEWNISGPEFNKGKANLELYIKARRKVDSPTLAVDSPTENLAQKKMQKKRNAIIRGMQKRRNAIIRGMQQLFRKLVGKSKKERTNEPETVVYADVVRASPTELEAHVETDDAAVVQYTGIAQRDSYAGGEAIYEEVPGRAEEPLYANARYANARYANAGETTTSLTDKPESLYANASQFATHGKQQQPTRVQPSRGWNQGKKISLGSSQ